MIDCIIVCLREASAATDEIEVCPSTTTTFGGNRRDLFSGGGSEGSIRYAAHTPKLQTFNVTVQTFTGPEFLDI